MEAGAQFDQRRDRAVNVNPSGSWFVNPGDDLQQRAFAGTVPSDQTQHLAAGHIQRHIFDGVENVITYTMSQELGKQLAQRIRALVYDTKTLRDILNPD